ncbi:hypothetical protein D3C87_1461030 [compost metagenome]
MTERDLVHSGDRGFGAIERGALGQLRETDEIFLVLRGHEATRDMVGQPPRGAHQPDIDGQQRALVPQQPAHAGSVAFRCTIEATVEAREEAAEQLLRDTRHSIRRGAMSLQQHGRKRGRQRQRVNRRDQRGDRNGDGELLIELAREAAQERERQEHG